jgi:hypothetical protein
MIHVPSDISGSLSSKAGSIPRSSNGQDSVSTRAFNFRECKSFLGQTACVAGSVQVVTPNNRFALELSGEVTLNGNAVARIRQVIPIANRCVTIPVGSLGELNVCIDEVNLPRSFRVTIDLRTPLFSIRVYQKTIVLARRTALVGFVGFDASSFGEDGDFVAFEVSDLSDTPHTENQADEAVGASKDAELSNPGALDFAIDQFTVGDGNAVATGNSSAAGGFRFMGHYRGPNGRSGRASGFIQVM